MRNQTTIGKMIQSIMKDGRDLADEIVVKMIEEKLRSPACIKNGYVLDGIPTHSENTLSIQSQLDLIFGLENPPNYLFDIQVNKTKLPNLTPETKLILLLFFLFIMLIKQFDVIHYHPSDIDTC